MTSAKDAETISLQFFSGMLQVKQKKKKRKMMVSIDIYDSIFTKKLKPEKTALETVGIEIGLKKDG